MLVSDLKQFETGRNCDELKWLDVSAHACKLLNSAENVIFVTSHELIEAKDVVDNAIRDGYKVVTIPENIKEKIRGIEDFHGEPIRDLNEFQTQWNESFEFEFVKKNDLTPRERSVFDKTDQILWLMGGKPRQVKNILISETMRMEGYHEAVGLWEEHNNRVIIKRTQLKSIADYAGTLLHEIAHAKSNASDVTREFESELTDLLGTISSNALNHKH